MKILRNICLLISVLIVLILITATLNIEYKLLTFSVTFIIVINVILQTLNYESLSVSKQKIIKYYICTMLVCISSILIFVILKLNTKFFNEDVLIGKNEFLVIIPAILFFSIFIYISYKNRNT